MRACGLEGRFFPSEGTLIALVRYGKMAFDLGGAVDHVDKDIDMKIFVRSQLEFLLKKKCITSYLENLKNGGWSCSEPVYVSDSPTGTGEPWFFGCIVSRREGGFETFGSTVELHVGRFFVAGDTIRMARNCSTNGFCRKLQDELGSVKRLWLPAAKCRAYDTWVPCPKSPQAMMQRSKEHSDHFRGHVALPAVAVERCAFHPGTVRLIQRGLRPHHMVKLRRQALLLHRGGWASFYSFWFDENGRPKPLPEPRTADMRPGGAGRFSRKLPVTDPVHTFMTRFRGLVQVQAFSAIIPGSERDLNFASGTAHASGLAAQEPPVEWVLYHKPLVRHASQAILQLAMSPFHLAVLWELKPLELCMAYFVDAMLRCDNDKADTKHHSYVQSLCKSWASHEKDTIAISNISAVQDRSFLQLLWLIAARCKDIPVRRPEGKLKPGQMFNPWLRSLRRAHPGLNEQQVEDTLANHFWLDQPGQHLPWRLLMSTSHLL